MEFPHIKDDKFPNVNNVNVWKFQNNFDYERWQGKPTIKILNVKWNSDYNDVPGFENDTERDLWFDAQRGITKSLETAFNITPDNSVRIPIPYNDAYTYNYLVVDMPPMTSVEQPIDYENINTKVSRWYYFIDSMRQYAPNTTELFVTLDVWTTFMHTVDIPYLMLERGHAPMMQTSVTEYLSNPIGNNEYLLADDFNYGEERIIQTSNYYPIGNGVKYVLFCAPYSVSDFAYFGGSAYSGNSTPPTYANEDSRWGYQILVNDYQWKYGDADYSNANLPINNQIQDGVLNGCACYAIEGTQAQTFFNEVAKNCVHFLHGIQAMFILDESMFTKGNGFTFRNKTIYPVAMKHDSINFNFTKAQFGFDSKYSEITKLYTFPYSELEITDDEGNIFSAKVENCGSVKMHREVSLIYPFLNYNVFFAGINGDGTMQYNWRDVSNTETTQTMWASDFSKFMVNWNIPIYSIFISSEDEYAANNFFGVQAKRAGAIVDYQNAVRYGNTTYQNVVDSMTTNTANVNRSTNMMVANMAADMATVVANNETSCDTAEYNVVNIHNVRQENIKNSVNDKLESDAEITNSTTYKSTDAQNDYASISYGNSAAASAISAGINTASSMGSGFFNGGLTGAVAGGISGVSQQAQNLASIHYSAATMLAGVATNSSIADITTAATSAYAANAVGLNNVTLQQQNIENAALMQSNNQSSRTQVGRTAATNNADAGRTKAAQDSNASATQTTETNNADWTRSATVQASKLNLEQKQREAEAQYRNAKLQRPSTASNYDGDFMPDVYKRRGVRMNIRTQTKSAIAQTGDAFLRFGYALHRVWDMSDGFNYGKHFTFWKAEDVWVNDGTGVAGNSVNTIRDILVNGVTVWKNPDEIGTLSIYDNI